MCDRDFPAVIDGCAEPGPQRARTWINAPIRRLYRGLFEIGHCHTVEVYDSDALVGGLYGVSLGRAFFGESMFHRARDASKIALVHLVARLRLGGFQLLDTQFLTDHLKTFGALEVPQERYGKMLAEALRRCRDVGVRARADRRGSRQPRDRITISGFAAARMRRAAAAAAALAVWPVHRLLLRAAAAAAAAGCCCGRCGAAARPLPVRRDGWRRAPLQSASHTS